MYYPYLRGLQFELIAIRELSQERLIIEHVCPIIEPVKESLNSLKLARETLSSSPWRPFLILNPLVGELVGKEETLMEFFKEEENTPFRPALIYQDNIRTPIAQLIDDRKLDEVMVICLEEFTPDDYFMRLLKNDHVGSIVLLEPNKHRRLDKDIKDLNKNYIRLDDRFIPEKSNSAYLEIPPRKFSEEHLFYKGDGYSGYSDFTLLPMAFQSGGWTPWAVAIHWSYINKDNQEIWMRHFTSETNVSKSNIQGKFAEAVEKMVSAYNNNEIQQNDALTDMLEYYSTKRYPGLGVIKKLSIKNHIYVNSQYIQGSL